MVSDKNIEPKIGLMAAESTSTEFEAFAGTVIAFCSRRMRIAVKKGDKTIVRVALIPFFEISEKLDVDMDESTFLEYRRVRLNAIRGLKVAGINFPFKICQLYLEKIRVSSDNIEVLGSDS